MAGADLLEHVHHDEAHARGAKGGTGRTVEPGHPGGVPIEGFGQILQPVGFGDASSIDAGDPIVDGRPDGGVAARRAVTGVVDDAQRRMASRQLVEEPARPIGRAGVGDDDLVGRPRLSEQGTHQGVYG